MKAITGIGKVFVALAFAQSAWALPFVIVDLGMAGDTESRAFDINNSGQVAGRASPASPNTHGFIYSAGVRTDIGALPGFTRFQAMSRHAGRRGKPGGGHQ